MRPRKPTQFAAKGKENRLPRCSPVRLEAMAPQSRVVQRTSSRLTGVELRRTTVALLCKPRRKRRTSQHWLEEHGIPERQAYRRSSCQRTKWLSLMHMGTDPVDSHLG